MSTANHHRTTRSIVLSDVIHRSLSRDGRQKELSEYTYFTRYAPFSPDHSRRQTWDESVGRVFGMHETRYADVLRDPERGPIVQELMDEARGAVNQKLVLGSQRALQFGGAPVLSKHARMYNCTVSYCDRPRFFQEGLWLLLCGCGVGFSVQKHHVDKLPTIAKPTGERAVHKIGDSIEGWADGLGVLMSSYFTADQSHPEFAGKRVEFDYSGIRPKGSSIANGMGKAPGAEPLKRSLEQIRALLDARVAIQGSHTNLRTVDAYDVMMHASDAVLAGGVRRSATICVFSPTDMDMATAKTGNWFVENPQRGRSNNSALLLRDKTTFADFQKLMGHVKDCGEPGFVWADSTEVLYNPCVEISMYPVDVTTGKSGWQFCNLCEINAKACGNEETFQSACRAGAILGTLQAGYTKFPYLGETTEKITEREALLGVSMTGMADNPAIAMNPEIQRRGAQTVLDVNAQMAELLGINPAARATCVKPAGSTSCLLGSASGIHPHHAKRYFRRVQANKGELPFQYFREHNPRAVEDSVWNPNGTDQVITFLMESPEGGTVKDDLSALDLLGRVRSTQNNWVDAGKRPELCTLPSLRHNVSNTIEVRPNEWDDITSYIFKNRHDFAGISLLPRGGDLDYPQAPFCAVPTADQLVKEYGVGAIMASGLIVDGNHAFENNLWEACEQARGRGRPLPVPSMPASGDFVHYRQQVEKVVAQKDWVRRAHKFARNYFQGDIRAMTYCLKQVHNCKQWEDLAREYVPVDYRLLNEQEDNTVLRETIACAGGKCDLV